MDQLEDSLDSTPDKEEVKREKEIDKRRKSGEYLDFFGNPIKTGFYTINTYDDPLFVIVSKGKARPIAEYIMTKYRGISKKVYNQSKCSWIAQIFPSNPSVLKHCKKGHFYYLSEDLVPESCIDILDSRNYFDEKRVFNEKAKKKLEKYQSLLKKLRQN
jgi:hypothetical protein